MSCEVTEKHYVNRLLELRVLTKVKSTGVRIDSGTLPAITVIHKRTGATVTGTPSWLTGGTGEDPTLLVAFTPNLEGTWEARVVLAAPYNSEERFETRVFA